MHDHVDREAGLSQRADDAGNGARLVGNARQGDARFVASDNTLIEIAKYRCNRITEFILPIQRAALGGSGAVDCVDEGSR